MSKHKRSFFERLTGTVRMDDEAETTPVAKTSKKASEDSWIDEESDKDAELTVDVYQTTDMIVVKAMIAGVRPEDLDVSITRDQVTVRGTREEERVANDDDFFFRELYWGSFSRTIELPEEIDVDEAEAVEKHGLLILKLPKLDKKRHSKLKVKTV
ncbi:MAG: Hsp20/alpha crystallin family protein [Candidatus Pacebacteria bacterium]|nr:Hsp20/alpha crystallin family protein [Candidatus Paceibacterota bacterium]